MSSLIDNRIALALCLLLSCFVVVPIAANAGDLVEFRAQYSTDGEVFEDTVEVGPGQMVMVRVIVESRSGAIMDIMGNDDLDFSRIGGQIEFFAFQGEDENGPCFVIYDEDKEILSVRCPFCEIETQRPSLMLFTITIRDDSPPGLIDPQIFSLLDLGPGEEGDPRPCTTTGPEPITTLEVDEEKNPGLTVLMTALTLEKEVSLDGNVYGSSVTAATGSEVFFRVRVRNMGELGFYEASLDDVLPAGFSNPVLVGLNPPSCGTSGQSVSCDDLGAIEPGEFVEVVYKATVTATSGTLVNEASALGKPGTVENPGTELTDTADARVIVAAGAPPAVIPTFTEAGWVALIALFGVAFVVMRRRV